VKQLKDLLSVVNDDFTVQIGVRKRLSDGELKKMAYPYPFASETVNAEPGDIGYSDKIIRIDCEVKEI